MNMLKCTGKCRISEETLRLISTACVVCKNHYDSLGITPKATQSDVKSAYYKLSMIYHPDKNKGSEDALSKFRAITEAYEVLGNFRLRKLYDKGILHTVGPQYANGTREPEVAEVEDDPQTKFYKSRLHRSRAPPPSGRTPIYNFDEWARAHYGEQLEQRNKAKKRYEQKVARNVTDTQDKQVEFVAFSMITLLILCITLSHANSERDSLDTVEND